MPFARAVLVSAALVWCAASCAAAAEPASISISCGAVGQEFELCRAATLAWSQRTGHGVQIVSTPADASERLALYQQLLNSHSENVDVLQIDVVWPGQLARHLLDLKPFTRGAERDHFESLIANNTVRGQLVAMPWIANAGLLFYRKDLLATYQRPVPSTWNELAATAKAIQDAERAAGRSRFWGYVWQGRAYEGLTCNALEWVASYGGGAIVDPQGRITIRNMAAADALRGAATWIGTITPIAVLNYGEEQARGVFQSGNALFMRNWPYAWALAQAADSPVKDKVGVATLPSGTVGGRRAAVLGGESLAVSRYSRNPAIAADLVMYLTSAKQQKERAIVGAFYPTRVALYRDKEILERNPFMGDLFETLRTAVARPAAATGSRYNQVSNEFWNTVHPVLSGRIEADAALRELERRLQRISRGGEWK
jgi:trehalose/maltose transport system substrate-binding protein